jgi:diguanylate cyclase
LACIVAVVDRLNEVSVKFGEPAANTIQRKVANILSGQARAEDIVCQLSDGKTAMLLMGSSVMAAGQLAERLRADVERQMQSRSHAEPSITCSFGVADDRAPGEQSLIDRTDAVAAHAQSIGRNCVSIARDCSGSMNLAA